MHIPPDILPHDLPPVYGTFPRHCTIAKFTLIQLHEYTATFYMRKLIFNFMYS
jgi:hypothetical protein